MEEYKRFWVNYVNFSGRSTRKEFWIPVLFNFVISGILGVVSATLASIFAFIYLIPSLSNAIRRLHDVNKSGWWIFINLVPFFGQLSYLVFLCSASVETDNRYN